MSDEQADGKLLKGQQYLPERNVFAAYTEQSIKYDKTVTPRVTGSEGTAGVDQTPLDGASAKVRTYDLVAVQAALVAIRFKYALRLERIDLPRELTAITVVTNSATGSGVGNHPVSQQEATITESATATINPRASAEASSAVSFEIYFTWKPFVREHGKALACGFYYTGNITETEVLTALAHADLIGGTVIAWPLFKPTIETLVLKGAEVSVKQSADSSATIGTDWDGFVKMGTIEYGDEYSERVGVSSKTIELPECIHGALSVSPNTATADAATSVKANTVLMSGPGGFVSAIVNEPTPRTKTATASITPTSLSATSPAAVPTTGKYLYKWDSQEVGYGVRSVSAIVLDMADYV
jgi:hypothetical protein